MAHIASCVQTRYGPFWRLVLFLCLRRLDGGGYHASRVSHALMARPDMEGDQNVTLFE